LNWPGAAVHDGGVAVGGVHVKVDAHEARGLLQAGAPARRHAVVVAVAPAVHPVKRASVELR